ncbi:MAG TPA: TRAP transporter substrate-binding protein [Woeseiaceae bacterium]|nr:TRAP transporter substrate-binding protein [Woeseiaceae bacterium]
MDRRRFMQTTGIGVLGAGVLTAATPARAGARKLSMVTSWPAGFPGLGTSASRVASRIEAATGGEIRIQVHSAGEVAGPFEVFAAVSAGKADLYHSAEYYQQSHSPAYNFFTAIPFGLTADEMAGWLLQGGGQALWDELAASRNIKPLMCTNTGAQMGGWYNREIRNLDDFSGLKIRMPGLGGEALGKLGAVLRNLPGGEIYDALQDGSLDAAEWVGPWNDLAAGMQEVAKHYYYPAFHEPGGNLSLGFNLDVWNSFTELQRTIITEVATAEYTRSLAEFNVRNALSLKILRDEHGVVPEPFSNDILAEIKKISAAVVAEVGASDAITTKIYTSFRTARERAMYWGQVGEEAFDNARRL